MNADLQYFSKILELIKKERGVDFSQYREKLLQRRVMSRVRAAKRKTFEEYHAYLRIHHEELDNLMETLTINVTEFFRDPKVFEIIEKKVIPELFMVRSSKSEVKNDEKVRRTHSKSIRIWSCGSSTGEEAYSVLMLIAEHLGPKIKLYDIMIYGTDIDPHALAAANEAVYEPEQFKSLSPERSVLLKKYTYDMGNGRFWFHENMTSHMQFQYHDITADAPLEEMDLILCRNMLIYFDRDLQNKVFAKFHQSLKSGGILILGNVESLSSEFKDKFTEYDHAARIYRKR